MASLTMTEREKILTMVDYLISKGVKLSVDIQGCDEQFSTRVIKLKREGEDTRLILENLYPELGNSLLQSHPDAVFACEMSGGRCVFAAKYLGVNKEYPEFGLIVSLPATIQIDDRRKEERIENDLSAFISVEFTVEGDARVYRLKVTSVGASGIGVVVDEESSHLLGKLNVGDTIKDMRFFLPEAILTIDGTVKHKTQIPYGRSKGSYVLGVDSGFIMELEELKEKLRKKT